MSLVGAGRVSGAMGACEEGKSHQDECSDPSWKSTLPLCTRSSSHRSGYAVHNQSRTNKNQEFLKAVIHSSSTIFFKINKNSKENKNKLNEVKSYLVDITVGKVTCVHAIHLAT